MEQVQGRVSVGRGSPQDAGHGVRVPVAWGVTMGCGSLWVPVRWGGVPVGCVGVPVVWCPQEFEVFPCWRPRGLWWVRVPRVGPHLELVPLDAADAARRVPPGLLGAERQLGLPEQVRARSRDVGGHLPQPLRVCRGVLPAGGPSAPTDTGTTPQHPQTLAAPGAGGPTGTRVRGALGQGWGYGMSPGRDGDMGVLWDRGGDMRHPRACLELWAYPGMLCAGMGLGVLWGRGGFLGCPKKGIGI